jgi:hypothetical protein
MAKKTKKSIASLDTIRENRGKDLSPTWENHENWTAEQFRKNYYSAMQYYNLETSNKDVKSIVIRWIGKNEDIDPSVIAKFKDIKDWRCSTTMSSIAKCLMRGMPDIREDFNQGRNTRHWLLNKINQVIEDGRLDNVVDDDESDKPVIPIVDKTYEISLAMCDEIENHIDKFINDSEKWKSKDLNIISLFKTKNAKSQHAKIIKEYYNPSLLELEELASGEASEDLRESYNHYSRKNIRKLIEFYREIDSSCNMIIDEAKAARKPKVKKPIVKDKLVEKLKYKKSDEKLKIVSTAPVNIIDSKELWVFDTRTRKLYKYIADEQSGGKLSVKGSVIIGYDEQKSIGKTLRNPDEQLSQFRNAGKVALKSFMDTIKTIEIKANGRITENQILLKTQS